MLMHGKPCLIPILLFRSVENFIAFARKKTLSVMLLSSKIIEITVDSDTLAQVLEALGLCIA